MFFRVRICAAAVCSLDPNMFFVLFFLRGSRPAEDVFQSRGSRAARSQFANGRVTFALTGHPERPVLKACLEDEAVRPSGSNYRVKPVTFSHLL